MKLYALFLPLLLLLPSCGALTQMQQNGRLDQVDETLEGVSRGLTELVTAVEEVKEIKAAAREAADVDKDGNLNPTEMLTYGGLLAAALAEMARRKMKAMTSEVARVEGRVEHERAQRKAAEEQEYQDLLAARQALAKLKAEGKA